MSIKREFLPSITSLLEDFPCVVVLGARQIGKSTLLKQTWPTATLFDLEKIQDLERIQEDPSFFLDQLKEPTLIDEAQLSPELFRALRVKIDQDRSRSGQFLLSGSSSPDLLRGVSESLAGRVAMVELGTFTWSECKKYQKSNFYDSLLSGSYENLLNLPVRYTPLELEQLCLSGGYPEVVLKQTPTFRLRWFENYVKTYIERDLLRLFPRIQSTTYRRFIRMLAASTGQFINASDFARSLDVSQPTIRHYFEIAEGTFFWRILPQYAQNPHKTMTKMPKGYICDSGLLCFMMNIHSTKTLTEHPQFGFIWESAVTEQLIKSLHSCIIPFKYYSYRTRDNSEIDLILEGPFGLIPIEIKSGSHTKSQQLQTLKKFVEKHNCPIGILINRDNKVIQLSEKIFQIPAGCI